MYTFVRVATICRVWVVLSLLLFLPLVVQLLVLLFYLCFAGVTCASTSSTA
jgi:hypothetical protein